VPALAPLSIDVSAAVLLCLYAVLGAITGLAATGFIRVLHLMEDLFDKIKNRYLRHALGMALVGVMIYGLLSGAASGSARPRIFR
jgi:chloride channel protein, CIC family